MALRHIGRAGGRMLKMHHARIFKRGIAQQTMATSNGPTLVPFSFLSLFFCVLVGRSVGRSVHPRRSMNQKDWRAAMAPL
jgi:hypothetical protein